MAPPSRRLPSGPEAKHSANWYTAALEDPPMRFGDRMFIQCAGGPCTSRLETFPPRVEIQGRGGLYVLLDDDPLAEWKYQFLPNDY